MSAIEDFLQQTIRTTAEEIINEIMEPVRVLKDYENVDILTLEEVCAVFRCNKEKMRDECNKNMFPHQRFGRDFIFPKNMIINFLTGAWKPEEKETSRPVLVNKREDKLKRFAS